MRKSITGTYAVVTVTIPNPFMGKKCSNYEPCDNYGFKKMLKKQYCLRCKKGEEHDKG